MIINIMGIDPSLSNTGVAVAQIDTETLQIVDVIYLKLASTTQGGGGKTVRKNSDDLRRAKEIKDVIEDATETYRPVVAVAEVPSGTQSARGSISNGICIGVLAHVKPPLIEVNPTEVKLAGHGTKTADKEDMVRWAHGRWPNAKWLYSTRKNEWDFTVNGKYVHKDNEHLADALGAIAAALKTEQLKGMLALLNAQSR